MHEVISIKPYNKASSEIFVNEQLAERINLLEKKRAYISFGIRKKFINISISNRLSGNEIMLSNNILEYLSIPSHPIYEINVRGNEILIGPCIGILTSGKKGDITKRRLAEISMNTLDYTSVHGAIILFTLDGVDQSNLTIEGYCYNHGKKSWEKGTFPYPCAIYSRASMNEKWADHFLSVIGDTVFNNYHFDKWEMFKWFHHERDIADHLPYTALYHTPQDIKDMLKIYKKVYVKPIWGMKGHGVVQVSFEGEYMTFRYRENDENKEISMRNQDEIDKITMSLFVPGEHIIQQGLELMKYNGGVIDFRSVMQKNESSDWVCNAIVARIGANESVVSNISSGGTAMPAVDLFKGTLGLSEIDAFMLREKMISLCIKVCSKLEEYGLNYGTLGLDLGIDEDHRIWIIEINNRRPHPAIALRVNDLQAYYTILSGPLHYGKFLAGFGS